jgi:hypothetical protein
MSKNAVTVDQLRLACWHFRDLRCAGVSENYAIRTLELMTDSYAVVVHGGVPSPHHVQRVPRPQWSQQARKVYDLNPKLRPKDNFVVEHGTPRRTFARAVLDLWKSGDLNSESLQDLAKKLWKLAVITIEEDGRLSKLPKKKLFDTPDARWAAAGIRF